MGRLVNATSLRHNETFADWVETAMAAQARLVIADEAADYPEHAVRLRLAHDIAFTPNATKGLFVTVVATDPTVADMGGTPDLVGEDLVQIKVSEAWTPLAKLLYPNEATVI